MAVSNKIFFPTFISSINYEPVRTLPHIYFYNGLKACETYFIQHYPSGSTSAVNVDSQSAFPYFDYYDGVIPNGDSNSLLFFNELPAYGETPSGSLYTEYWETYVSLLYNPRTRLFKASAIIPLADYFEMELNDIVQWRGNYYHLRAINQYNLKDGTCEIELLGPIIRDAVDRGPEPIPPGPPETCAFEFTSSLGQHIFDITVNNNTTNSFQYVSIVDGDTPPPGTDVLVLQPVPTGSSYTASLEITDFGSFLFTSRLQGLVGNIQYTASLSTDNNVLRVVSGSVVGSPFNTSWNYTIPNDNYATASVVWTINPL
jgi:hypothetical protein